ncbi:MAG: class I tRNA ligase family protein, partial [Chloroflexi bacterium]|nr:class I tRNA ligase family protein [Chloroflexota bacterium]
DQDKLSAHQTLYTCLATLAKLLAPAMPFLVEELYQNLVRSVDSAAPESVHLADWPVADAALIDESLSEGMRLAMRIASMGRAARQKAGIRVRQPLGRVLVKTRTPQEQAALQRLASHVLDELNIKEVASLDSEGDVVEFSLRPNLPLLGPKYGNQVGRVRQALGKADPAQVAAAVRSSSPVALDGFTLLPEEVLVDAKEKPGYAVALEVGYVVAVDTRITPELAGEGMARELVHRVQNMRRSAGFDIADRITLWYEGGAEVERVMLKHADYIKAETLTVDLHPGPPEAGAYTEEQTIDGAKVRLGVRRRDRSVAE